jgi:hypothetical protein
LKTLRWAGYFANAAAAIYVGATAAGSLLDPSYSQLRQHVSDLTASGASTSADLAPLYVLYNLLAVAFAVNLYVASDRKRLFQVGLGLLTINALAGVMMVTWFAEDLGGTPTTVAGTGHVIFASVSSIAIVVGSFVFGFAFWRLGRSWQSMSFLSFGVGILFILAAPFAVLTTAAGSDLAGLAERAAIAPFILWLLGVGCFAIFRRHESSRASTAPSSHSSLTVLIDHESSVGLPPRFTEAVTELGARSSLATADVISNQLPNPARFS